VALPHAAAELRVRGGPRRLPLLGDEWTSPSGVIVRGSNAPALPLWPGCWSCPPISSCMDEPTNHLDLDSSGCAIDALTRYEGTLLFVSHTAAYRETGWPHAGLGSRAQIDATPGEPLRLVRGVARRGRSRPIAGVYANPASRGTRCPGRRRARALQSRSSVDACVRAPSLAIADLERASRSRAGEKAA